MVVGTGIDAVLSETDQTLHRIRCQHAMHGAPTVDRGAKVCFDIVAGNVGVQPLTERRSRLPKPSRGSHTVEPVTCPIAIQPVEIRDSLRGITTMSPVVMLSRKLRIEFRAFACP